MRVKINETYEKYLESEGYGHTFPQRHARILFNVQHGIVTNLIVQDFENPEDKQYLYHEFSFDIGNCLSDWDEWEFSDVLIKIFVSYQVPTEIRREILFELSKVTEWRPYLAFWIWRNFCPDA